MKRLEKYVEKKKVKYVNLFDCVSVFNMNKHLCFQFGVRLVLLDSSCCIPLESITDVLPLPGF